MSDAPKPANDGLATAAQAFASSFISAAQRPGSTPDPSVSVAFALGWQMAELYEPGQGLARPPRRDSGLPGLGELSRGQRALIGLDQVDVALSRLKAHITEHGLEQPSTENARFALPGDSATEAGGRPAGHPPDQVFADAIFDLHVELLATLTAADFKLGKSYGLGRALAETTRQPTDLQTLKVKLEPHRLANLRAWLADLTSTLPPHAGHAVDESLGLWRDWALAPKLNRGEDEHRLIRLLRRQGERWRALLSDEKQSIDVLALQDYVMAGSDALKRLGGLTWRFMRHFLFLLLPAAALFGLGIWVILSASNSAHIAAGLSGVLASLGLTWKGVGGSLGETAAKLERPVWEAALDRQITHAITLLPGSKVVKGYIEPKRITEAQR